jgi:hypothetical protein
MLKYPLLVFSLSIAIGLPDLALALELRSPPVTTCQAKQGREDDIQQQLVGLEIVLYTWKTTQHDLVQLVNVYTHERMGKTEFEQQFAALGQNFSELTDRLNLETEQLKNSAVGEEDDLAQVSAAILAHKSATLLYMRMALGLGENEMTFEQATEQYDTTWNELVQLWNSTYSLYGCTSTQPWVL